MDNKSKIKKEIIEDIKEMKILSLKKTKKEDLIKLIIYLKGEIRETYNELNSEIKRLRNILEKDIIENGL